MGGTSPKLPPDLARSEQIARAALGNSEDIYYHHLTLAWENRVCVVIYIVGLTDSRALQAHILEPLVRVKADVDPPGDLKEAGSQWLSIPGQSVVMEATACRDGVYQGTAALLIDGFAGALLLQIQQWKERSVESPPTESLLRGPHDGFIENIISNVALVRRRLRDPALQVHYFLIGTRTKTKAAMLFLGDVAKPALVQELKKRIEAVDFDGIMDTSQLRELIVGPVFSPFPKMRLTERPDKVAASLLQGRVAVLLDTSPFAAVAPVTLTNYLWAPDDFYVTPGVAFLLRVIRLVGLAAATLFTPLYISIEMYNPAFVRTELALYLAAERQGIPLTPALEIIFLELVLEMVVEASVRLPSKIASAVTIVGGLIIGQAAVQARLVSSIVVIVVAVSAIGSFTATEQEIGQVWRLIKWCLIGVASVFGVYGLFEATLVLVSWLAAQDSFGTPYLAPLAPLIPRDLKIGFLHRRALGNLRRRVGLYASRDSDRTGSQQNKQYKDGGER